jgi:ABC-type multidrug transport system fused ATPase/permease subunit
LALTRELPPTNRKQLALADYSDKQGEFCAQIRIRNVEFQYNENEFALHNTNLLIEENKFYAIAGPSGSGKTTLMDLMLGIIEPIKGTVEISGIPANKAPLVFPGAIAYLPQDAQLIEGTVRDNIVLGFHPSEISDSIVWESLERAQLANFVRSLPMGIDSHIGPRGTGLSGGQRQRLVIARSLVTQPKILFLDEATSALDSETEAAVTESIFELKGSMTLIVIAHRLSTIVNADKIVYMRDGKIIEKGNFRSISEKIPQFAKESQLLGLE